MTRRERKRGAIRRRAICVERNGRLQKRSPTEHPREIQMHGGVAGGRDASWCYCVFDQVDRRTSHAWLKGMVRYFHSLIHSEFMVGGALGKSLVGMQRRRSQVQCL